MNYENDDAPDELSPLLAEWRAPDMPAALDARVLASFRQQTAPRRKWSWLMKPIAVPWPLAATAIALLCVTSWLALRKADSPIITAPPIATPTRFVEVPIVREKIVTRVVHALRPVATPSRVQATPRPSLPADLAGFRPVTAIKWEIVPGEHVP